MTKTKTKHKKLTFREEMEKFRRELNEERNVRDAEYIKQSPFLSKKAKDTLTEKFNAQEERKA